MRRPCNELAAEGAGPADTGIQDRDVVSFAPVRLRPLGQHILTNPEKNVRMIFRFGILRGAALAVSDQSSLTLLVVAPPRSRRRVPADNGGAAEALGSSVAMFGRSVEKLMRHDNPLKRQIGLQCQHYPQIIQPATAATFAAVCSRFFHYQTATEHQ